MGTRNLTCVQIDGQYKVAQYSQWDGYPEGQGLTTLRFLRDAMERPRFPEAVRGCRFVSEEDVHELWVEAGAKDDSGFVTMDVSDRFKELHPYLHRDCGANILSMIQERGPLPIKDSVAFAGDSLFCEWAYVVDFDKGTFEVFKGFNKEPLDQSERFAGQPIDDSGYYQVRLLRSFNLDALPDDDGFLAAFLQNVEENA